MQSVASDEPHAVEAAPKPFAGQLATRPSQVSAGSQAALAPAGRQTVVAAFTRSTHPPAPLHESGALQAELSAEPHAVLLLENALAGQSAVVPSHSSAGSQVTLAPAARQTVAEAFTRSTQSPVPLQESAALHPVLSAEPHAVLTGEKALAGQVATTPLQVSAGSQAGLAPAARQTVVAGFTRSMQLPAPSQESASLHAVATADPHATPAVAAGYAQVPLLQSAAVAVRQAGGVAQSAAAQQLAAGIQTLLHSLVPAPQLHRPVETAQVPAVPQSVLTQQPVPGAQRPAQTRCPAGQTQVSAEQICPGTTAAHSAESQQLAEGMQALPQIFWPAGQAQEPDWHVCPMMGAMQSALVQQVEAAMQSAPQTFWPAAHAHAPD